MSASPYVPFYTSDFLGGTSGMTAASKGVYITLLCLIYEAEAPLPQSWDTLARRCGCTLPAFKKAVEALQDDGKIEVTGAGIWSDKCAKHIAQRRERQSSAKAAAKTRWEKIQQNQRPSDKTASNPQCQPEPEPEPDIKKEPLGSSKKQRRKPEVELPEGWVPNDKNITDAQKKGFTMTEIDHEADSFRNFHHSKQSLYRDWDAAWRTWLNNAIKFGRRGGMAGGQAPNGYGQGGSIASIVARRRAEGKV